MALHKLIFDATDADSIADSANVGAYVRSDDGTLITHHTVGSDEGLDVYLLNTSITVDATDLDIRDLDYNNDSVTAHQGGTWTIDSITNDVNVTATDLDIRDLTHLTDSIKIGDGVEFMAVNVDGSINAVVTATDLDIRDLDATQDSVASHLFDGAGTALTSTLVGADQALDVNVVNGINVEVDLSHIDDSVRLGDGTNFFTSTTIGSDIGLDVNVINDPSAIDTAILASANTLDVANTSEAIVASALANRKMMYVMNRSNRSMYVGQSGVTTANGFPIPPGSILELKIGPSIAPHFVGPVAGKEIRALELS